MGSPVTPTDNFSQSQEPPIRSNHAGRMRYDYEQGATIPAYSKSVSVRLNMRPGQTLNSKLSFFQPSRTCLKLGLTLEATPLIEVSSRAIYVLFNNCMAQDIHVPKASHLGWLINQAFHDFELMVPVIGPIPAQLMSDGYNDTITFTKPHEVIAITSILPVSRESVCRSELMDDTHLTVYAVSTQPATEPPTRVTSEAQSPFNDLTAEEPYAGFNTQIQQILSDADALHNEVERQGLKEVLLKYKDSFAKDSLDCGLTNIHTVRIPTNPNAPPTFVRQYKIPIASYEPVQEIVDSMLEKGVIRPCNSTYSAPIWPVLKPNRQMAAHYRLPQVESASTIVTMAYDPVGPRNTKNQRLDDPVHIGRRLRVLDDPCPPRRPT